VTHPTTNQRKTAMKFKIGDLVKITGPKIGYGSYGHIGQIKVVQKVDPLDKTYFVDGDGLGFWIKEKDVTALEPVPHSKGSIPYKEGDKVLIAARKSSGHLLKVGSIGKVVDPVSGEILGFSTQNGEEIRQWLNANELQPAPHDNLAETPSFNKVFSNLKAEQEITKKLEFHILANEYKRINELLEINKLEIEAILNGIKVFGMTVIPLSLEKLRGKAVEKEHKTLKEHQSDLCNL
jgi:hypothetical protein